MTSYEPNFLTTIATYCRELAPISSPLLDCIGQTAAAIERAGYESRSLKPGKDTCCPPLLAPEHDEDEL